MASGDHYRALAANLLGRAQREPVSSMTRGEFENLAKSYLRLADQADLNSQTDVVYETPFPHREQHVQQQQQAQPRSAKAKLGGSGPRR